MSIFDKFNEKKKQLMEMKQRGIKRTEQMRAEKLRKRMKLAKPGTIRYGLLYKQHPMDLMGDVWKNRKSKRAEDEK